MVQTLTDQFKSPEQAREQLQQQLDATVTRMKQVVCTNAKLIITPATIDEKTKSVHPGDIQFDENWCQNDRSHGSKYCNLCLADRSRNNGVPKDTKE